MKSFKEYLDKNKREYKYTLKFAFDLSDDQKDVIEKTLRKLGLVSVGTYKVTPHQKNPLDFANLKNVPVTIVDVVTSYPSTDAMLQLMLANAIGTSIVTVVVYTENDPRTAASEQWVERTSEDFKKNYKPFLTTHEDKAEELEKVENMTLKDTVKTDIMTNSLIPDQKVEPHVYPDQTPAGSKSVIGSK